MSEPESDWPRRRYEALGDVLRAVKGLSRDEKHSVLRAAACLDGGGEDAEPDESARERIVAALSAGAARQSTKTILNAAGVSRPHGYRILRALAAEGKVTRTQAGSVAMWEQSPDAGS